jgi:DNA mismatch repair protein MutL
MRIRKLSEGTINRIAAGEVLERPASAVKELVENAIDAGATQIDVVFRGGGKTLIRVSDNGTGMSPDDLRLAVERHATSKLSDDDLMDIRTMGFRGEALPSIGSVARLSIVTRGQDEGHALSVEGGRVSEVSPASRQRGTDVEVRDLFYATPARLKFLKSDRSETAEAVETVRRLALANAGIGFSLMSEDKRWLDAPAQDNAEDRVARLMGPDFIGQSVELDFGGEGVTVRGFAGLPAAARAQATQQYAFVNGRPVRDKLISGAIRGAYVDVLPPGRHAAVVLFIACPPERVDVNVHPAKTEVRFRDGGYVRGLIVSGIRRALGNRAAKSVPFIGRTFAPAFPPLSAHDTEGFAEAAQSAFEVQMPLAARQADAPVADFHHPLGAAVAQVHDNYILAQTEDGMVIVDAHAAHERIVYERMKAERAGQGVVTQPLLVPQVVDLDPSTAATVASLRNELAGAGLAVEVFGESAVLVREAPAALNGGDIPALLRDVADDAREIGSLATIEERVNHVLATFACHHSVRAGRGLRAEEMNALLRQIERTPNGGECNHGRPTYVALSLGDLERLFRRR